MRKEWRDAYTDHTIDRYLPDGTIQKNFYGRSWSNKDCALSFMNDRKREYEQRGREAKFDIRTTFHESGYIYTGEIQL